MLGLFRPADHAARLAALRGRLADTETELARLDAARPAAAYDAAVAEPGGTERLDELDAAHARAARQRSDLLLAIEEAGRREAQAHAAVSADERRGRIKGLTRLHKARLDVVKDIEVACADLAKARAKEADLAQQIALEAANLRGQAGIDPHHRLAPHAFAMRLKVYVCTNWPDLALSLGWSYPFAAAVPSLAASEREEQRLFEVLE